MKPLLLIVLALAPITLSAQELIPAPPADPSPLPPETSPGLPGPTAPMVMQPQIYEVETAKDLQEALLGCDRITATLAIQGTTLTMDFSGETELDQLKGVLAKAFDSGLFGRKKLSPSVKHDESVLPGLDLAIHKMPSDEPPLLERTQYSIGTCWLAETHIPKELRLFLAHYLRQGVQHFEAGAAE